jgi:hypothetical protein
MPPGITYWDLVDVITPNGKGRVWAPRTKPMARISHTELTDGEIVGLLQDLKRITHHHLPQFRPAYKYSATGRPIDPPCCATNDR